MFRSKTIKCPHSSCVTSPTVWVSTHSTQHPGTSPRFPRTEHSSESYYVSQRDAAYLGVNTLLETCFLLHIRDALPTTPVSFSIVYCVLGVYILFWLDDLFYACFHALLHHPRLYTLLHAHHHHHLVTRPTRGYVDAGNEHPLEQCGAMFGHMCAIRFLILFYHELLYTHVSVLLHLTLRTLGSCLNRVDHAHTHSNWNGCVHRYRRAHHIRRRCNYAQFVPTCGELITRGD